MKLTDKIIETIGYDKLLHFFISAWLVSEGKAYGIDVAVFIWLLVWMLSFIKEKYLDNKLNYWDVWFSVLGGGISLFLGALS